ncbi:Uncharacterised protein [Bordetella pertussis]|nr:Uncharacterised protein [Bordetella pertussis]CFW51343.1 Uncharacterised protein [Bordetella pertussis]
MGSTWRWPRSSSRQPRFSSRRITCWLTVDWVRCRCSLARVKLPVSTTVTKLRSSTGSSIAFPTDIH